MDEVVGCVRCATTWSTLTLGRTSLRSTTLNDFCGRCHLAVTRVRPIRRRVSSAVCRLTAAPALAERHLDGVAQRGKMLR